MEKRFRQQSADQVWRNIPPETIDMLGKPETYTGAAAAKARESPEVPRLTSRRSHHAEVRNKHQTCSNQQFFYPLAMPPHFLNTRIL